MKSHSRKTSKPSQPWVLLNPGPVNVTERVRKALLGADICHREKEFSDLLRRSRQKILAAFGIQDTHTVAVFSGSGTTALEAMLSSFAKQDKKVLVLANGVYGDRMKHILTIHNSPIRLLSSRLGDFPLLSTIESALKQDKSIHGIALVHHETSTGMLNPLSEVGALAKKYGKTFLVDGISSLGAEKIDFKKDSIDYLAGTSGKCLHGFPGVSFVILKKSEVQKLKSQTPKSLYLDLSITLEAEEKDDTPFTPVVQIFYAFDEALNELREEGLSKRIRSYAEKNTVLQSGFASMGLDFLVKKESRSHVLTALWTPKQLTYAKLHAKLKEKGFIIYAGQSELKDKIFRVSNLGNVSMTDLKRFLGVLHNALL